MSEQTKFRVGDRVKYTSHTGVDYGTIVEVNGSIYHNSTEKSFLNGNIWVKWESDNQVLHLSRLDMVLVQEESNILVLKKIAQIEQQLQKLKALLKD